MMVGSPGEMLVRREGRLGRQSSLKTDSECLVWALERTKSLQKSVCERSNVKVVSEWAIFRFKCIKF